MTSVTVRNLSANDLIRTDRDGSDAYTEVSVGRKKEKTRYVKNSSDPVWEEQFTFPITSAYLQFSVFDYDGRNNEPDALGQSSVALGDLSPGVHDLTLDLRGDGKLNVQIEIEGDEEEEAQSEEDIEPTDEELEDVAVACARLWDLDANRLKFGEHFTINLQHGVSFNSTTDQAKDPLFSWISDEVFELPTFAALKALLDNYEADVGQDEQVTAQEMEEIHTFLDLIMETQPIRYCHKYLVKKGKCGASPKAFKNLLYGLWFDLYGRKAKKDSCGFEHVFSGEEKDGAVTGFHNWIKFAIEEKAGRVDYRGFLYARRGKVQSEEADETPHLITIKFAWEDDGGDMDDNDIPVKSMSSSFIGVSPEYEMALYTMCFLVGGQDTRVQCGEYLANIKCYAMTRYGRTYIGTAFPMALGWTEEE